MSVKILVNGQMKVVADVISPGVVAKIGSVSYIYSGSAWILCDGSAISRTTYSDLYAAISTTFGSGDGVNTFNVPTQSQANRITFSVVSNQTFPQFTSDADIVVNNPSASYVDISNGAAGPGIRISIIEQSNQGVTIYTDAGHTQSLLLSKGIIMLEWVGTYWTCVSAKGSMKTTITSGTTWKAPFTGKFLVQCMGGGGGAAGATGSCYGAAGTGANLVGRYYYLTQGTTYNISIGTGGQGGNSGPTNGAAGGNTTFSDGTITITAAGGGGGSWGTTSTALSPSPTAYASNIIPSYNPEFSISGIKGGGYNAQGGNSQWGIGGTTNGMNSGNPGTGYGSGGGGCNGTGGNNPSGGNGAPGAILIDVEG